MNEHERDQIIALLEERIDFLEQETLDEPYDVLIQMGLTGGLAEAIDLLNHWPVGNTIATPCRTYARRPED